MKKIKPEKTLSEIFNTRNKSRIQVNRKENTNLGLQNSTKPVKKNEGLINNRRGANTTNPKVSSFTSRNSSAEHSISAITPSQPASPKQKNSLSSISIIRRETKQRWNQLPEVVQREKERNLRLGLYERVQKKKEFDQVNKINVENERGTDGKRLQVEAEIKV